VRQLIDGTNRPPVESVAVGIEGERIVDILPRSSLHAHADDEVYEANDSVLMPGLVDSHVHLVLDHGIDHHITRDRVERASLTSLALLAARNAQMCLGAGITTVRDCGDRGLVACAVRDAVAEGLLVGPRILAAGTPVTTTAGHLHWCGCEADTADEVRKAVRTLCKHGVDLIKVVASGGNMTTGSNPLQPQYSAEELREAAREAHRLGRRVAAHSLNAESNRRAVTAGVDTIEHCSWRDPKGVPEFDAEVAKQMASRELWVGITMAGIARVLLPEAADSAADGERNLSELRRQHAGTRSMRENGVELMISSDAGVRFTRFEDFCLSLVCAVEALDMSPIEAIHRATLVPAEALGLSDEIGSIEPGKIADLVLVDGEPARQVGDTRNVNRVWQRGRLLVDGGLMVSPRPIPLEVPTTS
jgi:imidazolonepropionase-like amidohydrolase